MHLHLVGLDEALDPVRHPGERLRRQAENLRDALHLEVSEARARGDTKARRAGVRGGDRRRAGLQEGHAEHAAADGERQHAREVQHCCRPQASGPACGRSARGR